MYITLQKPSLTFPNKQKQSTITIFTNQLQTVNRSGLINHIVTNNKLSYFGVAPDSIKKNSVIRLMMAKINENLLIDRLLQDNENLQKYKIEYPIVLEIFIVEMESCINSLTHHFQEGENLRLQKKIGQGSFAEIFIATETVSRKLVCVKRINKQKCQKKGELSYISNQFEVLTNIQSKQFVQLYYAFENKEFVYFAIELCPYGDLYGWIKERFDAITLRQKYYWFTQIALAIGRLHSNNFLYRDLKPQNVLIDAQGNAKLCDFGYACPYDPNKLMTQICGSYEYIPPQLISKEGYNHSFDLYCLGLLFYELLTGSNPFQGITPHTLNQISKRRIVFEGKNIPQQAKQLIKQLLQKNPKKRLGYSNPNDIFKHRFFKQNRQIVLKAIKKEGVEKLDLKYRVRQIQIQQFTSETIIQKNAIPFRFYNYLSTNFGMDTMFGPTVSPTI